MKKKYLHLILLLSVYMIAYLLCRLWFAQGMPLASYTAGWLYRRTFMYTWIPVTALVLLDKPYTASFMTFATFAGMAIGDLIGSCIMDIRTARLGELINNGIAVTAEQEAQAYHHYGILPIWFLVLIVAVGAGIIMDKRKTGKS